jgi:hypothetical protein
MVTRGDDGEHDTTLSRCYLRQVESQLTRMQVHYCDPARDVT